MTSSLAFLGASSPCLALRVGNTGARAPSPVSNNLFRGVCGRRSPACQAVHDQGSPKPALHLLPPLAEGADRLMAEWVRLHIWPARSL